MNPFEENNGPRYGNAYENNTSPPPTLPPRKSHNNSTNKTEVVVTSPYMSQRMPSPSDYSSPGPSNHVVVNAWQESNKTLDEQPQISSPQNAYQYTGTPYGNNSTTPTPYSPNNNHPTTPTPTPHKIESPMSVDDSPVVDKNTSNLPSKIRWGLRMALFIAGVGHLGFAAGASPKSGQSVPFDSSACFYYLFAVAIMSIIYSSYHLVFYFFRRFGTAERMNRVILILCDLFMTLLWGIGIIVEITKYQCKPGDLDGWCDFYNTSIFFGFLSFAIYIVLLGWDAFGGLCGGRGRKD